MREGTSTSTNSAGRLTSLLVILLFGFIVALTVTIGISRFVDSRSQLLFEERANRVATILHLEFGRVAEDLSAARALIAASEHVTRSEWNTFFMRREEAGGVMQAASINLLEHVTQTERASFEARVRADTSVTAAGYPEFAIWPAGTRDEYYVVNYVYPRTSGSALMGFDSFSDPSRARVILGAIESDTLFAVAVPELLEGEAGIVPYFPIKSAGITEGLVTAAFTLHSVFDNDDIGGNDVDTGSVVFELYDGTSQAPLRRIGGGDTASLTRTSTTEIRFGNLQFLLVARGSPYFGLTSLTRWSALAAGLGTVLLTLLMFSVIFTVERSRAHASTQVHELGLQLEQHADELRIANEKLAGRLVVGESATRGHLEDLERSRTAMVSLLEDLTESRDQIEEARAFDAAILSSLADGVVVLTTKGVITRTNQAMLELNGTPDADFVGKTSAEAFEYVDFEGKPIPNDQRPSARVLAMGDKATSFRSADGQLRRKDGLMIPVEIEVSPIIRGGKMTAIVALVRDVTVARRIDRSKSEFVSLASHQLRTPLTAIGWYTELLLSDSKAHLSEEDQSYLNEIYVANRRMIDLIDSLLNVSRIEMGSIDIQPLALNLAEFIHKEIGGLAPLITAKNLTVQTDIKEGIEPYSADPKILSIIVQNLLSNAIKYTPHNGVVRVFLTMADNGGVLLKVADTGIGIPKLAQPRVFGKLYRADNAQLQDAEGSGLGLYLVRALVTQIGGEISFISEEGLGTTFTVLLPSGGMSAHEGSRPILPGLPLPISVPDRTPAPPAS